MGGLTELRWTVLETFAKVTRAYEDIQESVLNSSVTKQILPYIDPNAENQNTQLTTQPEINSRNSNNNNNNNNNNGLDDLTRLYLSRWAAGIVDRASSESSQLLNLAFSRWPSKENVEASSSGITSPFSEGMFETEVGAFEVLSDSGRSNNSFDLICFSREPLSPVEWISYYTENNLLIGNNKLKTNLQKNQKEILKRILAGGIDHDIRPEVWKYLLSVYSWEADEKERKEELNTKREIYYKLKEKWMDSNIRETEDFIEQASRIEKDVLRTDRHISLFSSCEESNSESSNLPSTNINLEQMKDILMCYHYHNPTLGYVQGMSDLLSPIYAVMQEEVDAFWCFVGFMEKVKQNFAVDMQGMHNQLSTLSLLVKLLAPNLYTHLVDIGADNMFMCFRWILIWFKREFSFEAIMRVWEVIWTDYYTKYFHLFIALGILELHQHVLSTHIHSLEEALRYINDLSNGMDYRAILKRAEFMFLEFEVRMKTHLNELQHNNLSQSLSPDDNHIKLNEESATPLIITPPPEIHSYTVTPSSPSSGPSIPTLSDEEYRRLAYLLEK